MLGHRVVGFDFVGLGSYSMALWVMKPKVCGFWVTEFGTWIVSWDSRYCTLG